MLRVAMLLPAESVYSTVYGGPVVRWTYEVVKHAPERVVDFVVLAAQAQDDFEDSLTVKKLSSINNRLLHAFSKLSIQLKGYLYCLAHLSTISKCDIVHVQNRPEYSIILRTLGYKGKIILHIHNERIHLFDSSYIQKLKFCYDYCFL